MAKQILIKRSSVAGKIPATTDLAIGEIAINLADQMIYTKRLSPVDGTTEEIIPIGGAGSGDGAAIYEILLDSSDFTQETFSIFNKAQPDLLADNTGTYDSTQETMSYANGDYFTTDNLILDGNSYKVFQIFINTPAADTDYTVEYSIDGGTNWITATFPYRLNLNTETSDFRIKVTSNISEGSIDIYGFGVLFDIGGMAGTNNVAFDVYEVLSADVTAGTIYELPQNVVYNPNGKELEVYRNGVKLVVNVHYTEEDSTHIKWLIDLNANDQLEFKQYYGYVFVDEDHVANVLTLQLNYRDVNSNYIAVNGDYIFADTSGGSFSVTLPASPVNGDTLYINDVKGTFDTNNLTVNPGGSQTIMGDTSLQLDVANREYKFIYNALNNDWRAV